MITNETETEDKIVFLKIDNSLNTWQIDNPLNVFIYSFYFLINKYYNSENWFVHRLLTFVTVLIPYNFSLIIF